MVYPGSASEVLSQELTIELAETPNFMAEDGHRTYAAVYDGIESEHINSEHPYRQSRHPTT